ncbi:ABC transporter amino acid-binding protein [Caballeronia sordidicola]|uniref:ABC transporter amino acid-binding protein n=1 Tax=Caballeronia sordidicola TaxID=196367 RepID=A0A226XAK7_CABSO|nr:ABC transporter amino acid-binding protein [Caballeronia sordidicola]
MLLHIPQLFQRVDHPLRRTLGDGGGLRHLRQSHRAPLRTERSQHRYALFQRLIKQRIRRIWRITSHCRHVRLKDGFVSVHGFTQLFGSSLELMM